MLFCVFPEHWWNTYCEATTMPHALWTMMIKMWWLSSRSSHQGDLKSSKNPAWNWLVWLWKVRQASCQEAPRSTCSWLKTTSNLSCIQIVANSTQWNHHFPSLLKYKHKSLHILHENLHTQKNIPTTYDLKKKYYHKYKSPVLKLTSTEDWRFQGQSEVYNKTLSPSKRKGTDR